MKIVKALWLPIALICLVSASVFGVYRTLHPQTPQTNYAPGTYSASLGPNLPNGKMNFAGAAFRFLYVIGFGLDGYVVTPQGDLVNVKVSNSGDIGCRTDAIAAGRSGDWLYLGCTRIWMGRESQPSVLPCRILSNGWIKPALQFRVPASGRPLSMTVDASGKHLYVGTAKGISQYYVGEDGKARPMTSGGLPSNIAAGPVAIGANHRYAYATNFGQNRMYQFSIGTDGSLKSLKPAFISTGSGPMEARCDPHGRYVWCLDSLGESIDRFEIQPDGALHRLSNAVSKLGRQASSLAITPDGVYAYVARYRFNSVLQYCIQPDGTFKPNDPISAPGAGSPSVVRVAPGGKFAAALNWQDGMVSFFSINRKGTLDAANPSVVLCSRNTHEIVFVEHKTSEK